jgi:DNA-binding beta-propeller fold protein YncE
MPRRIPGLLVLAVVAGSLLTSTPPATAQDVAHLYWTNTVIGELERAHADGRFRQTLTRPLDILRLELDTTNRHLYYSGFQVGSESAIYRADLDGSDRHLLIDEPEAIPAIGVNPSNAKLYWCVSTFSTPLWRANLDGTGAEIIVPNANCGPMAFDTTANKVYWSSSSQIRRSDFDGSNVETVVGLININSLAIDGPNATIYLSSSDGGIEICDLDITSCSTADPTASRAVQLVGSTVYYLREDEVWRMDPDGQNQQMVTTGLIPGQFDFALDPVANQFYFPDGNIFRTELDGSSPTPILSGTGDDLHDVAVDAANERIYTTAANLSNIVTGSISDPLFNGLIPGGAQNDFLGRELRGLVVDSSAGFLYATQQAGPQQGIVRVGIDGSGLSLLVPAVAAHDIALDPIGGKLYWTMGIDSGGGTGAKIQRSDLDGQNVEDILVDLPVKIRGIDVDPVQGKVYWTDMLAGEIWWADLDGASPEAIVTGLDKPHDVAVDPAGNAIYWIEGIADGDALTAILGTAALDGTSPAAVLTGLSQRARDLTLVYHRSLLEIFADGFESGDTSAWSATVP